MTGYGGGPYGSGLYGQVGTRLLPNQLADAWLAVEAAWGADLTADAATWTWFDITQDVMQDNGAGINLTIGRANEASFAQPATCTLRLKNQDGAYTPSSPLATNYPNVRLGTPVRVRVSLDGGSNWSIRFQGEAASWAPTWDAQGKKAYVVLTASGVSRRLGQGSKPLKTPLIRWHQRYGAVALWMFDDGPSATSAGSLTTNGQPMSVSGDATFGGTSDLGGTVATMSIAPGTVLAGDINGVTGTGFIAFDLWVKMFVPSATNTQTLVAGLNMGAGVPGGQLTAINNTPGPAGFQFAFIDSTGGIWTLDSGIGTPGSSVNPYDGGWHNVFVTMTQSGSNINTKLYVDGAQADSRTITSFTLGVPSRGSVLDQVVLGDTGDVSFAAYAVHTNSSVTNSYNAGLGYVGETADARLTRLCAEENVSVSITGTSATSMGSQSADTFMNLVRECEATDLGYLLDGLGPGLTYVCHSSLQNQSAQMTIDANSGQVPATPGPLPALDDQRLRNRVTVTSSAGTSAIAEDVTGPLGTNAVGVFDDRRVVNTQVDKQLSSIASWLVHLGTVEGMRYPQIIIDFAGAPELATTWVGATPTDRIDVTNLGNRLTQHPSGDVQQVADGWFEMLAARQWRASINCSAYRPWEVFTIADSRLGRIEPDPSTLNSSATTTTTSLSVALTGGAWSTTSPPFDIEIEGEQITVTAISGSSSPQTFTVTRSVNGLVKAHNSGVTVKLWRPGVLAL